MKTYQLLFLLVMLAAAMLVILGLLGRDNYSDDEGMRVEGWKRIWSWRSAGATIPLESDRSLGTRTPAFSLRLRRGAGGAFSG